MAYIAAAVNNTGLRASELASLTPASFDLAAGTVTLQAGYSKRKRRGELPLHHELAKLVGEYIAGMAGDAPL